MIEYLMKLNKYQKGMIVASFIFLISMVGFMFNSRVRLSESYIEEPEIIIEDPIDIDDTDSYKLDELLFMFVIYSPIIYLIIKGLDKII